MKRVIGGVLEESAPRKVDDGPRSLDVKATAVICEVAIQVAAGH